MNKEDCENLGYLLATNEPVSWRLCQKIFDMDDRIEPEYELFKEVRGESDEITDLAEELMIQYNSHLYTHNWSHWSTLPKDRLVKTYKECLDEARKTVLGDDYDPSLFRR